MQSLPPLKRSSLETLLSWETIYIYLTFIHRGQFKIWSAYCFAVGTIHEKRRWRRICRFVQRSDWGSFTSSQFHVRICTKTSFLVFSFMPSLLDTVNVLMATAKETKKTLWRLFSFADHISTTKDSCAREKANYITWQTHQQIAFPSLTTEYLSN